MITLNERSKVNGTENLHCRTDYPQDSKGRGTACTRPSGSTSFSADWSYGEDLLSLEKGIWWSSSGSGETIQNFKAREYPPEAPVLVHRMVELAMQYGRYGYRRITALLQHKGLKVNQ